MKFFVRNLYKYLLLIILLVVMTSQASDVSGYVNPTMHDVGPARGEVDGGKLYLPVVATYTNFAQKSTPIWVRETETAAHGVGLFRRTFWLNDSQNGIGLHIFADTRYEVYLDGDLIGRGPARFSAQYREYDSYAVEGLSSGKHVLAVLVQWAPNERRSESEMPFLQAKFWRTPDQTPKIIGTNSGWKVMFADAWNSEAALVHAWELLGPSELLDFRQLPLDWTLPKYDDSHWENAVEASKPVTSTQLIVPKLDPVSYPFLEQADFDHVSLEGVNNDSNDPVKYRARSIEMLANYPVTATLVETGQLSAGQRMIEFSGDQESHQFSFRVSDTLSFFVEGLGLDDGELPFDVKVDNVNMVFQPISDKRPDVLRATRLVLPGDHVLLVEGVPEDGATLSISAEGVTFTAEPPFAQGDHAGRRLLLAEPHKSETNLESLPSSILNLDLLPSSYAVIDLGRTMHGRAELEVTGESGTIIDLGWDERLYPGTNRPLPFPGSLHWQWNQVDSWVLDGTNRTLTTIDARAGRYLLLAVWGDDPVSLAIKVSEERYPVTQLGYFDSSNDLLDQIWQVGVDTAYPNMTDAYADPWRERGQWWGDSYVVDHVNRVAFGEDRLLRRGLLLMAYAFEDGKPDAIAPNGDGVHMIDYAMLWVHALEEYLQLTDDAALGREVYPTLVAFLEYLSNLENPSTGLLDLPDDIWARTIYIDPTAGTARRGQSAAANAFYAETYSRAAAIAELIDEPADAANWSARSEEVRKQINKLLYLPDQNRYSTSIYQGEIIEPTIFAQAWPLAYGIVDSQNVDGVVAAFDELLVRDPQKANIGIYGLYWVLEAFGKYGYIPEAIDIIENYYDWMLSQGATTWWEGFTSIGSYGGSLSHGWGGSPTWFLSTYVLGARQTGMYAWQVKPAFQGVSEVTGAIPVQDGLVTVSWTGEVCKPRNLDFDAPGSTKGTVILVDSENATILLNGKQVWPKNEANQIEARGVGSDVYLTLTGGTYHIEIDEQCQVE